MRGHGVALICSDEFSMGQAAQPRLDQCLGQGINHAIVDLVTALEAIHSVSFVIYRPAPGLNQRLDQREDPSIAIRRKAQDLNENYGVPFWDAVLSVAMKEGSIPETYVDLAILHDKAPEERTVEYRRDELTYSTIDNLLKIASPNEAVALSSKVQLRNGGNAHIPMMDFRCHYSEGNSKVIVRALHALGEESGLLVESGRSYHFYGLRLMSNEQWVRFMALGALFSPIVDVRYIAHRLADGACRLRIGPGPGKTFMPVVREVMG